MKKILVLMMVLGAGQLRSQTVAGGLFATQNVLTVRVKPSGSFSGTSVSNLVFSIRWDTSYHISVSDMVNSFGIIKDGGIQASGSFNFQNYATTSPTPISWAANQQYDLGTITLSGGTGTGTIQFSPTGFTPGGSGDWYVEIGGIDRTPPPGSEFYQSSAVANLFQTGAAAKLGIQTQPSSSATAGASFTIQPSIAIQDGSGNLISTDNSTVVTATRFSGTGTLQGTVTATASGGIATFTNLSYNIAETITIRFTSGGLTPATSNSITVGPAAAAIVNVETAPDGSGSAVPGQSLASGSSVTAYSITRDGFGNFVANASADAWSLQSRTGGVAPADLVQSVDHKSATFTGHVIGSAQIAADFSGLPKTPSGVITVTAGNTAQIRVETNSDGSGVVVPSQSLPSGTGLTVFSITRDASGNFVSNSAATWSLQSITGGVVSGDLVPSGDTKSATLTGHSPGSAQIRAASGGLSQTQSGTITVTSGAAVRLQFASEPANTQAAVTLSPVTVQLKDGSGNNAAVSGDSVTLTLVGTGTLSGTKTRATNGSGLATFNDLSIDVVGAKQLIARGTGLTPDTSVSFTISPGAPRRLVFVQQPTSGHTNVAISPAITVQVQDTAGNNVPTSGISVGISKSSGSGTMTGTTPQSTNGSGVATFADLKFDTQGSKQITASSSGLTSAVSTSFTVSPFTISASASGSGTISPSGSVAVNGGGSQTFTISPNSGNHTDSVVVDGVNQGVVTTYPFTNVLADHSIAAYFSGTILTITASAGPNGSISPSGSVQVSSGSNQSFTITPNSGYHIDSILVDGAYAGNTSPYNFANVTSNHTISAKFAINTYTITASSGIHGSISPAGAIVVNSGASQTFTMTADTGYHIQNVLVDGTSRGAIGTFTFTNVVANHTISASFAADSLTITVQSNPAGRSVIIDGITYTSPKTVRWLAATTHTLSVVDSASGGAGTRYIWTSWSDSGAESHSVSPLVSTSYTAGFATQYLLTMNANTGGTVSPPTGYYNAGQVVQIQAFPSSIYVFSSWAGSGNGSTNSTQSTANVTMNSPITETANFDRKPITITIQANPQGRLFGYNGGEFQLPQTRVVTPPGGPPNGPNVDIYTNPQPDLSRPSTVQYLWSSWSDGGSKFHYLLLPDSDITYTAFFKTQFKLNLVARPGGTVSPSSGFQDSVSSVQIQATPNTGYIFKNWRGSGPGSFTGTTPTATVTMNGAINDTATFALDTMVITATAGANGTISPSGGVKVPYGGNQTFTIRATGLYHISDVVVDGSSVGPDSTYTFTNVTSNHTIAASFTINGYTITATAGPGGSISPSGPVSVNGGASQTFTITPNAGYHIDSVQVDGAYAGNSSPYTFTAIDANHTIRGIFAANPQAVTIQTNPAGLGLLIDGASYTSPHIFSWAYGSAHTIAVPDTQSGGAGIRSLWAAWSDGGAKSHAVTVNRDSTFTATFTVQYFLTMNAGSGGTVSPPSGWLAAGQGVSISATPTTGNSFSGWVGSGSGSYTGANNPASITMNGPVTETASFGASTVNVTVTTNLPGRSFTVDNVTYTSPQTFLWTYGNLHTVGTTSPQAGTAGTQYVWSNWNDGKAISHSVTALNDTTLIASFTTQYYLTMIPDTGGSVSPASGWQNSGVVVPITAVPSPGFRFTGWAGSGAGSTSDTLNPSSVTMNGPITETGNFTRFGAQVTIQTNPSGRKITVDNVDYTSPQVFTWTTGSAHTVSVGDTLSGSVGTRYIWLTWSDSKPRSHSVSAVSDTTFTANFRTQYYLTMNANVGGTVTPPSGWFNRSQVVNIIPIPDPNYSFTSWSGNGYSGFNDTVAITINQPITETASFRHNPVQVTINTNPAGRAFMFNGNTYTIPQTVSLDPGTQIFLGVNSPQTGGAGTQYVWKNWSIGGGQFPVFTVPDTNIVITANFVTQYFLTVVSKSGGTVSPASDWQDSGKAIQLLATANPGYSFIQWKGRGTGSYTGFDNPAAVEMDGPITDTASFSQFAIHVVVRTNPAGLPMTVDGVRYDTTQTFNWVSGTNHILAASSQTGDTATRYNWNSWSDGGSITHTVTPIGDSTFTAGYSTQYYLTMIAGNGGTVSPPSGWFAQGSAVPISASPNLTYLFGSWNGTGNGSYSGKTQNASVTVNGPITESASFARVPVSVTVRANLGGRSFSVDSVTYTSPQTFRWDFGSSHVIGTSSPQAYSASEQFSWRGWSDGGAISHTVIPFGDTTFTAIFTPQFYLTMSSDTGGTVSPGIGWQDSASAVQITGVPHAGFRFAAWSGQGTGSYTGTSNPASVTMAGPISESASFTRFTAQVTVQTNPTGLAITVDGSPYTSPHVFSWTTGSAHTISSIDTTAPAGGSRSVWAGWNDNGARTHSVVPNQDTTFTATYTTQYFLTTAANVGGSVTPPSGWYSSGQSVTITGIPDARYNFSVWSGSGSGSYSGASNPTIITVSGPITETGNFNRKPVQIVVQTNPPGRPFILDGVTYTIAQTRTVDPGTQHYLDLATSQSTGPGAQYSWRSWSDGGGSFHSIFPDSNTTYTAIFVKQFYLTVAAAPGGSVSPANDWHDTATVVSITAIPDSRYAFGQWRGSGTGSYTGLANPASVTMSAPVIDSAFFQPAFQVMVSSNPPGRTVMIDDSSFTAPKTVFWVSGSHHTIATTPSQTVGSDTLFTWKNWSDGGAISHSASTNRDTSFTVVFRTQYYLTMGASAGGVVTPPSGWYAKDSTFQVRAVADSGHAFVEWNGGGSGSYSGPSSVASVTMTAPIFESATFGLILSPPTLAGIPKDSTGVSTSPVLSWMAYPGANSYRLQLSSDSASNPDGSFKTSTFDSAGIGPTQIRVFTLANRTIYYWHVSARVGNNITSFSAPWDFTTIDATISLPATLNNWATGYTYEIRWSTANLSGPVNIKLTTDGGTTFRMLKQGLLNTGLTLWKVPDSISWISPIARLRVESSLNPAIYDQGSNFSIVAGTLAAMVPLRATMSFPAEPTLSTEYRLFSGPGIVDTARMGTFLIGNQKTDWRIYRDNGAAENYLQEQAAESFLSTGEGYWLIRKGDLNIPNFTMIMPKLDTLARFGIPLHVGWNIIGNPFDRPVSWQSVIVANHLVQTAQLEGYSGSYAGSDMMDPFVGYYYFNSGNLASLKIPYPFGPEIVPGQQAPEMTWRMGLEYQSDINSDRENYIGIAPAAKGGIDPLNQHKPPLFLDQGFLYFSRPEWDATYSRFSSDIRPSVGEGQSWEFEVSNPRKSRSTIRVKGIDAVPGNYEVILINKYNSVPVDLRKSAEYGYQAVASKMKFTILVGTKQYIAAEISKTLPSEFELAQNFPNPFNLSTSISVRMPRDAKIRVDVYSVLGQHVKTLADDTYSAGTHTFLWDGTDRSGAIVASGVYFYRLLEGTNVQTKKMILTK